MIGHSWAKGPFSRIATAEVPVQQLYAELEIAIQLERDIAAAAVLTSPAPSLNTFLREKQQEIHIVRQGKYMRRSFENRSQPKCMLQLWFLKDYGVRGCKRGAS